MKRTLTLFFVVSVITTFLSCNTKKNAYYHIIMIEYKQHVNMDKISTEVLGFKNIPSVLDLSFGKIEKNKKNKIQNFTYCLKIKFKDKKGLKSYLTHPYHQKIYQKHKPLIAAIYTADFYPISLKK